MQTRASLASKISKFPLVISILNSSSQSSPESSVSSSLLPLVPGAYQLRAASFLKGRAAGKGAAQWACLVLATQGNTKVSLLTGWRHPVLVPMGPTLGECLKEDCHPKATSSDFYQKAGRNFTKRNLWLYSLILKCNVFFYVYTCLCSSVWVVMSLQIRGPRVLFLGCCLLCFVFAVGYLTCFGTQQSVQLVPGICPSLPSWH